MKIEHFAYNVSDPIAIAAWYCEHLGFSVKHKFNKSLYKRVEFLQGRWVDLTSGKKFFLGTLTFLAILTYGLYLVVIRSLNSLILSINTFTTLGFGDIPVVGISRYVAILEGFLGWFLLSIFSVSLISQILQN